MHCAASVLFFDNPQCQEMAKILKKRQLLYTEDRYFQADFNPILHGLLEIRYHMGGDQNDPPLLKSIKTIKTWLKCMFWQKQVIFAPNFCIRRLFSTIFDPKKGQMRKSFLRVQKGPPFGFCMKKNVDVKYFEIFKKKTQTGLPRTIQILKGTKS